ncbi:hypothetical protein DV738_g2639, partial [Chaetothyriales sp. CBS 135597]
MAPSPTMDQRIHGIIDPAMLLYMAVKSYILTLINVLVWKKGRLSDVRNDAFAQFWDWNTLGSALVAAQLLPSAEGVVLELGPGTGYQIEYMAAAGKRIRKIYGAEPCVPLHTHVLASARKAGLADGVYEVVTASAERESLLSGLEKAGLFDKETCETLYQLLKPGGKLLFAEHVVNPCHTPKGSRLARVMQTVYSLLGWSYFVGSCHLTRNTDQILLNTPKRYHERNGGGKTGKQDIDGSSAWREVQLDRHFGWSAIPYVSGTLVK